MCWSTNVEWVEASGRATLYTWSVVHRNDLPPFPERVPYVAAVVDLEEGPRMMTNVVDCEFDALEIGMPLEVVFQETSRGRDDPRVPAPRCRARRPGSGVAIVISVPEEQQDWNFPFEGPLDEVFPALHEAQNAWLSQIDSLKAPDRKTHELIRLVCTVILRNPAGVRRHAMLAEEVGASWDEMLGSIMLTLPGFGLLPAVEAIPHARARLRRRAAGARERTL